MTRFRLLGPLEVWAENDWRGIGASKWRSVLAALLINSGQVVPTEALIEELWPDTPPAKAANLVSIYVLRLRRMIEDPDGRLLVTRAPGYQLRLAAADTDVQIFEAMVKDGRRELAEGSPERAASKLAEALALWRGRPLADVPATPLVEMEAERLTELRLDAAELYFRAQLGCGQFTQVVPAVRKLLADYPLREGLWLLLMKAMDGAGRHAEALDVYAQARSAISDQLGVDPGVELRQLYGQMLAADSAEVPGSVLAGVVEVTPGPDAAAPRSAASSQRPAQLPADVADFTGREEQVARLCELLSALDEDSGAVRIALVAGWGGLGKTSLAVHAAHQVRGQFPDGQLYVDLLGATQNPLASADVLARFLRDLGVDGREIPIDEDERAARFRTILAGRRILLVLDNARDAAQVRPLLPGTSASAVLITTRSRMPDLASTRLLDLNVLDDDDALTLFAKIVGEDRAASEPEATAELLLACSGLPLAIRICAARLTTRSGWSIRSMANRLRDQHRLLDELKVGDLAVRASFQVSFATLPEWEDSVGPGMAFCLLGLWQGASIPAAAAAALFGVPEYLAGHLLEALVDTHLLESNASDRYKFHDLLRVYASERANADVSDQDRAAAITRMLTWYMRTADAVAQLVSPHRYNVPLADAEPVIGVPAFATIEDALGWYDDERVNVVAATKQAAAIGLHDVAWRLPASLFSVFNRRGNWADLVTTHHIARDSARAVGNRQAEAWVLNNLGEALGREGSHDGIELLRESLAIRREIGDPQGEAQAAHNLAEVYYLLEGPEEALPYLQQSLEVQRATAHSAYSHGVALNNLGEIYLELGRLEESAACLREALPIFMAINSPHGQGHVLLNLGRVYLGLGQGTDALDSLRQAADIHRTVGDKPTEALALRFLGLAQLSVEQPDQARKSLAEALNIFTDLDDAANAAQVESEIADLEVPGS